MNKEDQGQPRVLIDIFRWILLLPGAVASAWIIYICMSWAVRFGLPYADIRSDSIFVHIYDVTLVHGMMGAAFVLVGTSIAPAFRGATSFALAGIGMTLAGFLTFPALLAGDWWAIIGAHFIGIGAGILVWML